MPQSISQAIEFGLRGDYESLQNWLSEGNNPNEYDDEGWTPLLAASVRGHAALVALLLDNDDTQADISMPHAVSKALPIHFAGHSGDIETTDLLLKHKPEHINAVWYLNAHTVLLQAAFYGWLELADYLVRSGADTSYPTARYLTAFEMARQFQNKTLMGILEAYPYNEEDKKRHYDEYMDSIKPSYQEDELPAQKLSDELFHLIDSGIRLVISNPSQYRETIDGIKNFIANNPIDVNRLGGPLQQPPLVVAVTGNNGEPTIAESAKLRFEIARVLLDKGADPTLNELHPMGVDTIIRGAVFNHLDILKLCSEYVPLERITFALNRIPIANGLTALHDSVLRASTAGPDRVENYLRQIEWAVSCGARSDIPDFSGRTQKDIAANAKNEAIKEKLLNIL